MADTHTPDLAKLADDCVARLNNTQGSFTDAGAPFRTAFETLIGALRAAEARFAFDRDGRPGAIAAVRGALPAVEADILDAVVEDHACELAALQEALYRVAVSAARRP